MEMKRRNFSGAICMILSVVGFMADQESANGQSLTKDGHSHYVEYDTMVRPLPKRVHGPKNL